MMSIPATTSRFASHKRIANQIDTATRFRNAQILENPSGAVSLRNRFFVQLTQALPWVVPKITDTPFVVGVSCVTLFGLHGNMMKSCV